MATIFALDLAQRCGYAVGALTGDAPRSGAKILKKPGDHRRVALGNLVAWLNDEWREQRPSLVVVEAPLPLQAYKDRSNSADRVRMDYGLHGVVEAMCARFGLRLEEVHPATVRKHFIGRGRMGERDATKAAVVQRCHVLGYMPKTSFDPDRADALATWDWAAATFGRLTPAKLHMFGEAPARTTTLTNPKLLPTGKQIKSIADRAQARSEQPQPSTAHLPREKSTGPAADQAASQSECDHHLSGEMPLQSGAG